MNMRHTLPGLLLAMLFFLGIGCEQSRAGEPADALTPAGLSPDTVLRVHWRGRDDLGIMAGAYYFMRLWELPQSGRVEVQTLSRLATVPWPLSPGQTASTNQAAALLYPLLADVIWSESYSEIRQAAHQPAEFRFCHPARPVARTVVANQSCRRRPIPYRHPPPARA